MTLLVAGEGGLSCCNSWPLSGSTLNDKIFFRLGINSDLYSIYIYQQVHNLAFNTNIHTYLKAVYKKR